MKSPRFLETHRQQFPAPPDGPEPLEAALTRRAWCQENGTAAVHHEPLEFLGDRVLNLVVADELHRRWPDAAPGSLNAGLEQLVSDAALADLAHQHDLVSHLRAGRGEVQQRQVNKDSVLADHVEAIIGAAWRTGGLDEAAVLVHSLLDGRWPDALPVATATIDNPIGALNEAIQARWRRNLDKSDWVVERTGPDHSPTHRVDLKLPDGQLIEGEPVVGGKKAAMARTAAVALQYLQDLAPEDQIFG